MAQIGVKKSKHQKQADVLVERIKKARQALADICLNWNGNQSALPFLAARRNLEIAMFGWGAHYVEYACDCYKRIEEKVPVGVDRGE